ncbi:MAG: pyridoxal phosphate-dependent decarboxylase family protein [Candidatus Nanopelagicales bacterium]
MKLDRERALDHARDLVAAAWEEFDEARDIEPPISTELLATLDLGLPEEGIDVVAALDEAVEALDQSLAQARPRYLAYIGSSGLEIGALADLLAHSYDPNLALHAGAATLVEAQALRWVSEFVGYPMAGGSFTSGGTVSNVTALAAAREMAVPGSRRDGVHGMATVYCSSDAHYSITRAVELLGIGSSNLRDVPIDEHRRMRPDALAQLIAADIAAGRTPIAVVGTGGTTLTGAVDPLDEIADVCREFGVWMHVDGAYGLPAASVLPERFRGLERADSVSIDAHKWMFVPKACGIVMVRDESALAAAFGHETTYIPGTRNAVDVTLEYSRPLRALKLWLAFRVHGAAKFREAIARNIEYAHLLHTLASERDGWEVGPIPDLSITLMRYRGIDNAELVKRLQADGRVYISHAVVDGETWLRPCFTNPRTTVDDVQVLMDVADEVARA